MKRTRKKYIFTSVFLFSGLNNRIKNVFTIIRKIIQKAPISVDKNVL